MSDWTLFFDFAAIFIMLTIFIWYFNEKMVPSRPHKAFLGVAAGLTLMFVIEIIEVMLFQHIDKVDAVWVSVVLYIQIYVINITSMIFSYYIKLITRSRQNTVKKFKRKCIFALIVITMMVIVNMFTDIMFVIDNGKCVMNYGIIIPYGIAGIILVFSTYRIVRLSKEITLRKSLVLLFNLLLTFFALLLQIADVATMLSFFLSVNCLTFYHYLQNPLSVMDTITGLFNRRFMGEYIQQNFGKKKSMGVIFVAMDDFKFINKAYGVQAGDKLLSQVGEYLNKLKGQHTVFRFGSDQFCIVLDKNISSMDLIAEDIHDRFKHPWFVESTDAIMTSASICIIECPQDAESYGELIEVMDYSMALAKKTKKGGVTRASELDLDKIQKDKAIEKAVKLAMDRDELKVYYQPIYSVEKGVYNSAEALVRLQDDELGWISPEDFIPIAEKNGLMVEMGDMILEKVCHFIRDFKVADTSIEYIEVNISTVQMVQQDFADRVKDILEKYNVKPSQINMEITETAQTSSMNIVNENIKRLVAYGIKFSLDDYGSGNSNIDYINKMPFSIIKLDKYIVWDAFKNDKAGITLEYTIGMLNALKLLIVAEGVETEDMKNHLVDIGCHYMQGWYYSKAVCDTEFMELIQSA